MKSPNIKQRMDAAFNFDTVSITKLPRGNATLHLDGLLFATGQVEIAEDAVRFFPVPQREMGILPSGGICLSTEQPVSSVPVTIHESFQCLADHTMWFFQIVRPQND
jgi:hypothetical protein